MRATPSSVILPLGLAADDFSGADVSLKTNAFLSGKSRTVMVLRGALSLQCHFKLPHFMCVTYRLRRLIGRNPVDAFGYITQSLSDLVRGAGRKGLGDSWCSAAMDGLDYSGTRGPPQLASYGMEKLIKLLRAALFRYTIRYRYGIDCAQRPDRTMPTTLHG